MSKGHQQGFVQTERSAHEAWGLLTMRKPSAAALMHVLVSNVGVNNSVTASYATLAEYLNCSVMTVRRAIEVLRNERWIEVVQLGGAGSVNSYIINSKVAWHEKRDNLRFAKFTSTILASSSEQPEEKLSDKASLRSVPLVQPGELQLPSGPGLPPVSQPFLGGLEPDLPRVDISGPSDAEDALALVEVGPKARALNFDPETGEIKDAG